MLEIKIADLLDLQLTKAATEHDLSQAILWLDRPLCQAAAANLKTLKPIILRSAFNE